MRKRRTLAAICFTLAAGEDTIGKIFALLDIWKHFGLFSVDATKETSRLGRLINHSKDHPNCFPKLIEIEKDPKIVIFAKKDISTGTELLFDYGDR